MKNEQHYVLLYSKYSEPCKNFVDVLKNIEFPVNYLCVDNKTTRKRITNSSLIKVTSVPCLLHFNNDSVNKYEGNDIYNWLENVIPKPQPIIPEQKPQPVLPEQLPIKQQPVNEQPPSLLEYTSIDDIKSDEEDDINFDSVKPIIKTNPYESEDYITKKKKDNKKDGLLSAAMEMAKNRDIDEKSLKPPKLIN